MFEEIYLSHIKFSYKATIFIFTAEYKGSNSFSARLPLQDDDRAESQVDGKQLNKKLFILDISFSCSTSIFT